jgi:hypothetical protein
MAVAASRGARREPTAAASLLDVCASNPLRMRVEKHTEGLFVAVMAESQASRLACCPHPVAFQDIHAAVVHLLCSTQLELWHRCLVILYSSQVLTCPSLCDLGLLERPCEAGISRSRASESWEAALIR